MLPRIAEVVFVAEDILLARGDLSESKPALFEDWQVGIKLSRVVARVRVVVLAHLELVQMAVGPAHRDLQDGMQPVEFGVRGHV